MAQDKPAPATSTTDSMKKAQSGVPGTSLYYVLFITLLEVLRSPPSLQVLPTVYRYYQ